MNERKIHKLRVNTIKSLIFIELVFSCIGTNFGLYNLFYLSLMLTFVAFFLENKIELKIKKEYIIYIMVFFAATLISTLSSEFYSFFRFFRWFLTIIVGYLFYKNTSENGRNYIRKTIYIIMLFTLIEGTFQYITGVNSYQRILVSYADLLKRGTTSIFLQHIIWGQVLVLYFFYNEYKTENPIIKWMLRVWIIFNIYASKARSSWLVFLICLLLLIFKNKNIISGKISKKLVGKIVISFSCIFVIAFISSKFIDYGTIWENIIYLLNKLIDGESLYRQSTIKALFIYRIQNFNPIYFIFGSGSGSAAETLRHMGVVGMKDNVVDNQFVTVFFEMGFLLAAIWLIFLYQALNLFFKSTDNNKSFISLCFIIVSLSSLVYESFGYQVTSFLFFFILGVFLKGNEKRGG